MLISISQDNFKFAVTDPDPAMALDSDSGYPTAGMLNRTDEIGAGEYSEVCLVKKTHDHSSKIVKVLREKRGICITQTNE